MWRSELEGTAALAFYILQKRNQGPEKGHVQVTQLGVCNGSSPRCVYSLPAGTSPSPGQLRTTNVYSPAALEAGSLKSGCQPGQPSSKVPEGGSLLGSPSFWWVTGSPWGPLGGSCSLRLCLHTAFSLCVCLCSPFLRTAVVLGSTLTVSFSLSYLCKDLISKLGHIRRCLGLGCNVT